VNYIAATFERAGIDRGAERAAAIMALETQLAANHWTRVEQRDRQANYKLMTRAALQEFAPEFPWD
jgi:putative endopeptidase